MPLLSVPVLQRLGAELAGTALLVFFGAGAAVVSTYGGGTLTPEGVAAANGLVIVVLIYALGHISGAHLNPAVTLAFAAFRHFQAREVLLYWPAQFAGALIGAAVLLALFGDALDAGVTGPSGSIAQAFTMEVVLSFLLMFVITAVATDSRAVGQAAAIAVGATVALDILIGGAISGASMNPARSFGPAAVSGQIDGLWVYLVAPPLGALLGGLAYTLMRGDQR
jgi:aquaporin NIP